MTENFFSPKICLIQKLLITLAGRFLKFREEYHAHWGKAFKNEHVPWRWQRPDSWRKRACLLKNICGDGGVSSSDGWYGSAKANRPPCVYISPRDFATLAPPHTPCTSPSPERWFPPRRRFTAKAFSSNQTYPYTSAFPLAPVPGGDTVTLEPECELESRREVPMTRLIAISGYGCIPQVLAPENFRAREVVPW